MPGVGEKTASALLLKYGGLRGSIAAAEKPDSDMAPSPRKKILAAGDYFNVAPTVVEVARAIKRGRFDATLPSKPAHPQNVVLLAEHCNLGRTIPADRCVGRQIATSRQCPLPQRVGGPCPALERPN